VETLAYVNIVMEVVHGGSAPCKTTTKPTADSKQRDGEDKVKYRKKRRSRTCLLLLLLLLLFRILHNSGRGGSSSARGSSTDDVELRECSSSLAWDQWDWGKVKFDFDTMIVAVEGRGRRNPVYVWVVGDVDEVYHTWVLSGHCGLVCVGGLDGG